MVDVEPDKDLEFLGGGREFSPKEKRQSLFSGMCLQCRRVGKSGGWPLSVVCDSRAGLPGRRSLWRRWTAELCHGETMK